MKYLHSITFFVFIALLVSCVPTVSTLTGSYQDKPYEIKTDKDFETVWSNLIDLFAQKGISIKIIDKSSGLIVSEKTSFKQSYTTELNGKAADPNAWIVLNKVDWMGSEIKPDHVYGEWNARIKNSDGGTIININLTNIDAAAHFNATQYSSERNFVFEGKSTGKFESIIAETIK